MATRSVVKLSRLACPDSGRYIPLLFLAPALQSSHVLTISLHPPPPAQSYHRPFSTTYPHQARLRNREKNKSRGVSAIRGTGPRVPLSVSKYPLPEPVWDPPLRKEFKTREDHGLWGFFNEARAAMMTPEDLDAHGRAWTAAELANKRWEDLWKIWWMCLKERNRLSTDANERKRVEAGYGEAESQARVKEVQKTMFRIRKVLINRQDAFDAAVKTWDTEEYWRRELRDNKEKE